VNQSDSIWPELSYAAWRDTAATLQLWTQIIGKIRLALTPWMNHSWHVTLYVTARGLGTSAIPARHEILEFEFDFLKHQLVARMSDGGEGTIALEPQTVADFYRRVMALMEQLGVAVRIHEMPNELPDAIPFSEDRIHRAYDAAAAHRFWRVLIQADRVLKLFRSGFLGKASPVHFFWGSFDLAVTRFSGRRAPKREGADSITREANSHEVSSVGFWPGGGDIKGAAFYSYAAPEPAGFAESPVRPQEAFYHPQLKEFILMYDDVRRASSPRETLLAFLQSTYEAAAELAKWDRKELERSRG
jgi:hypothetical protein